MASEPNRFPLNQQDNPPQGWQCPKCRRVYAPHVDECRACRPPRVSGGHGKPTWIEFDPPSIEKNPRT